ncbi:MAG TPA: LLM class flavin-dependent oxidoreductase, partial [Candidatus Binatia bacterium]|nr:LLM class flavin-dependent oxidoreductase [Candidatus Binatia bacterium]
LFQRDIVSYLSLILNSTKKLKAASGIINTYTRHPVVAATTFGTLSEFSNGRAIMGLGLGSFPAIPKIGQRIFPVKETRPIKRVSEYVDLVRALWSGNNVNFHGKFFQAENLQLGFKIQNPILIYIAGLSPELLELAGKVGDGALLSPALATVETTKKMSSEVKAGEASVNRKVDKASYIMASLDPDPKKAQEAMKGFYFFLFQLSEVIKPKDLEPYGVTEEQLAPMKEAWKKGDVARAKDCVPNGAVEALTLTGTKKTVQRRLEEYLLAGVDLPIIMPIGNVNYAISSLAPKGST